MTDTVDVVVIGGGMAGASIAYELAEQATVLLLESEKMLATHSTGRSAATYLPSYGGPTVRALTAASRELFDDLAGKWGDVSALTKRSLLWTAFDDASEHKLKDMVASRSAGLGGLETIGAQDTLKLCPAMNPDTLRGSALDAAAHDIDVLAVHQAYIRGFKSRGGTIRTGAPVTELSRNGERWSVVIGSERIETGLVVDAAGAWADHVAALAGVPALGLIPKRRTLFLCPTGSPIDPHGPTIGDPAERWYFKPEGDGILASPADADPVEPGDAKPSELGIARAMEEINEATTLKLRTVRSSWGGLRTFAPDGEPVAGLVPEAPGFGFLAGQGGYGIQMAPALAVVAAAILTGNEVPDNIPISAEALSPQRLWN
ncbi:FAD-binding oxidoreductase [Hoyosella rhizosphaerae]|uniref:FAD-dependent catabolic D-arginine dehydrogenase DauA n=1 Tax=Hoyosella rhizosphaerae TaxID=1755582 RepID=A0A916XH26_9ACTN|nr:FAD-binding oxidoreductase [Hoyosella rhizosphaerae]MBN4925525.1 FAD-binding oxidoreductase [Hoyosella rhizosphaerae]GGC69958.1 FAD-dependent catabolic D-arginine dehydrogenase DauA [Hoyosella rhizosphaerae]